MNTTDFWAFYKPAAVAILGELSDGFSSQADAIAWYSKFDEMIGEGDLFRNYSSRHAGDDFPLRPELRNLFQKMKGPHAHTVLQIYRARKGLIKYGENRTNL